MANVVQQQLSALPMIITKVMNNYPAILGFALTDFGVELFLSAIPNVGGMAGQIVSTLALSTTQVAKFAAWDVLKMA